MNWRFWDRSGHDTCAAIEPLLSLFSDDMASPAERRRIEAHLQGCPGCRQALEWMQATRQVISLRPALAPPADLRARIARAIAESDAAKAPAVKAPAVAAPARRPLRLRPALAYGLSLALIGGIAADLAWNGAHPTHTHVAVRPALTTPPAPQVASDTFGPQTSAAISGVLGHFSQTFRSALVASPPGAISRPAARLARAHHDRPAAPVAQDVSRPPLVAQKPPAPTAPHASLLPRLAPPVTRLAKLPPTVRLAPHPQPILPAPHGSDPKVAAVGVPPETHTLVVTPPPSAPPATVREASRDVQPTSSLREVLFHAVVHMSTVSLTPNARVVNAETYAGHSTAVDSLTDRSGTASITRADLR